MGSIGNEDRPRCGDCPPESTHPFLNWISSVGDWANADAISESEPASIKQHSIKQQIIKPILRDWVGCMKLMGIRS
jgi:hypothetical protein